MIANSPGTAQRDSENNKQVGSDGAGVYGQRTRAIHICKHVLCQKNVQILLLIFLSKKN